MKTSVKIPLIFWFLLVIFWGTYRYFIRLPEELDELIIKPIVWIGGVFYIVLFLEKRSLSSIGWTTYKFFENLYLGWGIGAFFALEGMFVNAIKYRGLLFFPMGLTAFDLTRILALSLATGLSEETVFRGYIFSRFSESLKNEWLANILSSLMFSITHLPIALFVLQYNISMLISYEIMLFVLGLANGFIFARRKSIVAPTISHALWNLAVVLFR